MMMIVDASAAHFLNGLPQSLFAFEIEAGIRLVEHDQAWMSEEGPRQAKPLPLPAGQAHAALADIGFVAHAEAA